jgi:cytochrome c-type biogenesis protein CcmH
MPAVALGALLATLAMVTVVALRPAEAPGPVERADALARELRCPDCQGLSVADSPTASAQEIRRQIDELVAAGASGAEVRAHFVARYGEWVLLAPASPAAWLLPFVVVAGGAVALAAWLLGRRTVTAETRTALSAEERRRLREEAEALDG